MLCKVVSFGRRRSVVGRRLRLVDDENNRGEISSTLRERSQHHSLLPPMKQNTAAIREAPKRQLDRIEVRGDSGGLLCRVLW